MVTVIVESADRDLINEIWSLKTDGVDLEQLMAKAGDWPAQITAYIELASASLIFIAALLDIIKRKQGGNKGRTKTIIKTNEHIDEIRGVAARYERITHIEIHEEN